VVETKLDTVIAAESTPATGRSELSVRSDNGETTLHAKTVPVVQVSVPHGDPSSRIEGVRSTKPKYSPTTVSEAPPVSGVLNLPAFDATGASNEKGI
jgi:hypothetical protein